MAKNKNKPQQQAFEQSQLEVNAEGALALVGQMGDQAAMLVQAWIDQGNAEAVSAVAWSDDVASPVRKAARRGLNVLKSRGVKLPEREKKAVSVEEAPAQTAWFMPSDANGMSMYAITSRARVGQNLQIVEVYVHEEAGVVQAFSGHVAGGGVRAYFKRIAAQSGFAPVEVPVDWARWRVAKAKERNATSKVVMPMAIDSSSELLEPVPETAPEHPAEGYQITLDDELISRASADSATLHRYAEFESWLPDVAAVQELLQRVGQRMGPAEERKEAPEVVRQMMDEEVLAAVDRYFTPEVRDALAQRMKEHAVSVFARLGKESAALVLATAEAVRRAGLITSPPSQVPFLKGLFQKGLAVLAARNNGQLSIPIPAKEDGSSQVVVAPPEAIEQAARTRAGLSDEPGTEDTNNASEQPNAASAEPAQPPEASA